MIQITIRLMIIPIRCYSCGFIVADKYKPFLEALEAKEKTPKEILDGLGLHKICCRRMLVGHVDLIDIILPYSKEG